MADIRFTVSSLLASGSQSYALSSLISVSASQAPAPVLALRVYDRDNYAGPQSFDYGHFNSPLAGQISAGTQYRLTTLYFDYTDGQYVSRDTGEALSAYSFTPSDQNYRSAYLSLFTSAAKGATYDSSWLDPSWNHLSDLNVVTRTDYVDATPNAATPEEIAALAKSFIGKVWNDHGCWLLTSNVSAAAGASLPVASGRLGTPDLTSNGQWQVVFNGAQQTGDWRALLQTGDIVELGYYGGTAHIATVTSGSGHLALWVDNSGPAAKGGAAGDIVIQGEHAVDGATTHAIENTIVIFRLSQASSTPSELLAPIAPPVVTGYSQSMQIGQSLPLASLFSVQDPNLLPMSSYQIVDQGGGSHIQLNGATNLATAAQQQAGTVIVAAADLSKLSYLATLGPDTLTITAFDGQSWGSARLTVTGWVDPPPTVTGSSTSLHATSQFLPAASLFAVATASGHTITEYRFTDTGNSGQVVLADKKANLASNEEAALGIYRVGAADLGTVGWKVLADTGSFSVSAFDGVQWSDYAAVTVAGLNTAPTVTALPRTTVQVGQAVSLASLFTLSDAEGDAVTLVSIYNFSQNIQLNGAHDSCPNPYVYQVTLAELPKLTYTAPDVMGGLESLFVNAYDGTSWSDQTWVSFTLADPRPVVQPTPATQLALNQKVPLAQLFRAVDPNGNLISEYQVQDPAGGGRIQLNGAANLATAAQQAQGIAIFAAGDLAKVSYLAGSQVGSEPLALSAYNGSLWGTTNVAVYTTDNSSPVVRAAPATLDVGQTTQLGDLCSASNPSGKPITQYLVHDPAGAGKLLLNGAIDLATAAQQGVLVSAADFGKLQYLAADAAGSEVLSVSAYDGASWGQADLLIEGKDFNRPVVTTIPQTVHAGQRLSLQDLFRVSNASGKAIDNYQIDDTGQRIDLNGAANIWPAQQYLGMYGVYAYDLSKVFYVAGSPGTVTLYIEASDLAHSSMMVPVTITVLPNPVITPTTVALALRETVALSSLFLADNPSGKTLLQYKVIDPDGAGTVYLNGAANLASADEQAQGISIVAAADLAKLSYKGASAYAVDPLTIAAYDGDSWGASEVPVTTIDGTPPVVSAPAAKVAVDSTSSIDSLFAATSHTGAPISLYKIINPLGGGKLVLNGAANLATPAQQAQEGMAIVSAADLSKLQYVGADAPGSETLTVSAFDGQSWGTASLTITSVKSAPPLVTPVTAFLEPGQSASVTSLFSVTDPADQPISVYVFQDSEGNIQLNGATNLWAAQQSSGYYWIAAADIAKVSYVPSRDGVFHFNVLVNDGLNFGSWTPATVVAGRDRLSLPPAVTPAQTTVPVGQAVQLGNLFATKDPIGNAITEYSVLDPAGGGTLLLNGAADLATADQHASGLALVAAADLSKLQYRGAATAGLEVLTISAYDGLGWGGADVAVTSAILPPLITAATTAVEFSQTLNLSAMFSATTSSGRAISEYKVQDPAGGGAVLLRGATNLADAAQQAQGISIVSAQDLAKLQYAAAASAGSETLLVGAYDGQSWGASNIALSITDNRPPLIAQTATAIDVNETRPLAGYFSGSSPSGRPVVEYTIEDPAGGGRVLINSARDLASAAQHSQGTIVVAAYDLASLLYVGAGTPGSETLAVSVSDGNNATSAEIAINSVSVAPPVVTVKPVTLHAGDTVSLASLFSVANPNGYPIQHYFVTDPALGVKLNGAVNGFASSTWDYQGHFYLAAADWSKVEYQALSPGTAHIGMQADDSHNVSNYADEIVTVVGAGGTIDAGGGTVIYAGSIASFTVAKTASGYTVKDASGGKADTLANVSRLQFADAKLALDVDGSAGSTAKLIGAAFGVGALADNSLVGQGLAVFDQGYSLRQLAQPVIQTSAFQKLLGSDSNAAFVTLLYRNVLGDHSPTEAADIAYFESQLDLRYMSQADLLVLAASCPQNIQHVDLVGLASTGLQYIS